MSPHTQHIAGLEPRSVQHAIKTADDQRRGSDRRNDVAIEYPQYGNLPTIVPTLDDFRGRSDALGGRPGYGDTSPCIPAAFR
jgi:hypothetical protein